MKRIKKKYSSLVYGIDIETTTINILNNTQYFFNGRDYSQVRNHTIKLPKETKFDKDISFMFSYCVSVLDFTTGDYKKVSRGRNYAELDAELSRISSTTKDNIIMYVHNFSYEFSFFINNLAFFKDSETFALDLNKPVKTTCKNIEFRCSRVLLDKSIKTLGDELGIPKLDFKYDTVRTTMSRLTSKEWEYNFRDVEIMLKSVYRLYKNNDYMFNVSDIPLTKTSVSRFNCEKNDKINCPVEITGKNGKTRKTRLKYQCETQCYYDKAKSIEQYNFWISLFRGGLVYSNPGTVTKVLNNIMSFDFSSDYPYQMLYREYPANFYEILMRDNKYKFFNEVVDNAKPETLIAKRMGDRYINCKIVVANLKAKFDFYPFSVTSIHSDFNEKNDGLILNGKIKSCFKDVELWLTHVDVVVLALFYSFDLVDIIYLETTKKIKQSHDYRLNCVTVLGSLKKEYKEYNKLVSGISEHTVFNETDIPNKEVRDVLNGFETRLEQIEYMNEIYLQCKGDLNSLYGDNAQHPIREEIFYDYTDREFKRDLGNWQKYESGGGSRRHKTSYIYGLYVPTYARASILYFSYMFLSKGVKPLYIDTDSIKIKESDYPLVKPFIDSYNKQIKKDITDVYGFDFGTLEHEDTFKYFVSLGSKSYLFLGSNNQIKAVISGLPNATEIYTELYETFNYDFNSLVKNCFHFNTIIDYSVHNKHSSTYKAPPFNDIVNKVNVNVYGGCVLKPVDLTLRGEKSTTWQHYRTLIKHLYGFDIETNKTTIKKINDKHVVT